MRRRMVWQAVVLALALASACAGGARPMAPGEARFSYVAYDGHSQEDAKAGPGQYVNPVLSGYYPDPSITRAGRDYYLVNSSFAHFPGLPIFHSRDLVSWTQIGNAIDRPGMLDFSGLGVSRGVFAPDISFHDGRFWIVNTCVDCGGNFVITATDPRGPWSDPVWFGFDGIDPSLFWDDDGRVWLINNGPPDETPRYDGHRALWLQEFDAERKTLIGPRTVLVNGGVDIATRPSWIEGPHIFKKDGVYYLIAAEGGTGDRHSEVVFRASAVTGPYVAYPGNPILSQRDLDPDRAHPVTSAGHGDFVQTQAGEWWATFLATRPYGLDLYNIGRETFLLPVTWTDGWPTILPAGTPIPFVADRPRLAPDPAPATPMSGDFGWREEFDGSGLGPAWIAVRRSDRSFYRVAHGALVLAPGPGRIGDKSTLPAFIGRRQQHHVASLETELEWRAGDAGGRAGLIAMQNDDAYLFFGLEPSGGGMAVVLRMRASASDPRAGMVVASAPLKRGDGSNVRLRIRADGGVYGFDYAWARDGWTTLKGDLDGTFLSTRMARGFVGVVIGPYVEAGL